MISQDQTQKFKWVKVECKFRTGNNWLLLYYLQLNSGRKYLYDLYFPFLNLIWDMGFLFIPFGLFVIIGSSNAVNLTDGLDGLATANCTCCSHSFNLLCSWKYNFSEYLRFNIFLMSESYQFFVGQSLELV